MTPFSSLSSDQKLALNDEQFRSSVRAEAVLRGMTLPVKLDFKLPTGSLVDQKATKLVFEIWATDRYDGATGLMFEDEAVANEVAAKALCVSSIYVNSQYEYHVGNTQPSVRSRRIYLSEGEAKRVAPATFIKPEINEMLAARNTATEALRELSTECMEAVSALRIERYNVERNALEWQQYLSLASGNAEIAAGFWRKNKGCEPPVLPPMVADLTLCAADVGAVDNDR